jgi:SAM-dependent methyltransferase
MKNGRYTDKNYWESYYRVRKTDKDQIVAICSYYDPIWDEFIKNCNRKPNSILEIGAYPGRYISYIASKYDLKPTALDFNTNTKVISDAFELMSIKNYNIIETDLFDFDLTNADKYDLVYSLGFIEHFENIEEVLQRHCDLIVSDGSILVMVPNKLYFRKWFDYIFDYDNFKIHNLKAMKFEVFHDFAKKNSLEITFFKYYGVFAYNVHQNLNMFKKGLLKLIGKVFIVLNPWIKKNPNKYFSSAIFIGFKKNS